MKSLTLLSQFTASLGSSDLKLKRTRHTVNPENGDIYFVRFSESNVELVQYSLVQTQNSDVSSITFFPNDGFSNDLDEIVKGIKFLIDIQSICIAFGNGDIVLVHLDSAKGCEEMVEAVGHIESRIKCMEWSPDEELVIFVTGNDTILEMTKDFDVITEFPVNVEELGEAVSISVGWGKKETQFHGSEGKTAAQKVVDTPNFTLSEDDDFHPRVSWCGDGSMFCCSVVDTNKGLRVIRVYNREGILQSTSEPVDKLGHVLSWRPAGNLIASNQKSSDKHEICFFEKNGLRHGEFSLREIKNHKIIEILWNCDSTILAVWLEREISNEILSCVQLWYMNNYHWYLKQEILPSSTESITSVSWDPEVALILHYTTNSNYYRLEFSWDVLFANTISASNAATVAVIDGCLIYLTPFRIMNVPPPMFAFSIQLDSPAVHVSFSPNNGGNDFAVLQANQEISFFEWPGVADTPPKPPKLLGAVHMGKIEDLYRGSIRQIAWINKTMLFCLHCHPSNQYDDITQIILELDDNGQIQKKISETTVHLTNYLRRLYYNPTYDTFLCEVNDGSIHRVIIDHNDLNEDAERFFVSNTLIVSLPEVCNWIGTIQIESEKKKETFVIGLSEHNKLYVNENLIAADCTSFFIHNDFIIFTTSSHVVRFLPLHANLLDLKVLDNVIQPYDETIRRVERGSKIIFAAYYDVFLVLQMPRGNLETIYPRALVLSSVRDFLNKFDYLSAYKTCRKHRIDLNILYDHNPDSFLKNVQSFVTQIEKLVISNKLYIRNEDVMITMYPPIGNDFKYSSPSSSHDVSTKVNIACEIHIYDYLFLPTTITNHLLITDQDMDLAEDAIKFAIFLVDADRLFDVALGLYDFGLVLMVAQQSQKDPREYLPFLTELESYPKYYQQFKIDDHLCRYEKALKNLSLAGDEYFDDCLKYIREHGLYHSATSIFANNNEKYKSVMAIYGDYLFTESNFKEAGLAFILAGDKPKALDSYKNCGSWREAFAIAQELNSSSDSLFNLAQSLAEILSDKRQYQEAAQIILDYTKQPEESIILLNKGRYWTESIRISHMYKRTDLIETNIKPSVIEGHTQLLQDVNSMLDQLNQQTNRLKEIRANKANQLILDPYQNDESIENVDTFSDTSSMTSGFTRYTMSNTQLSMHSTRSGKSAKSRRRQERKKARGKKGSIYEEGYLLDSLKRLIERFNTTQAEILNLLNCLVTFGYIKRAQQIQVLFSDLEERIKNSLDEIFDTPTNNLPVTETELESDETRKVEKPKLVQLNWKLQII
ncbi:8600_t:CDS:10 [Gigaspora rosea]|nr:8600_t:CDS:10 [Gigaspora rosea]